MIIVCPCGEKKFEVNEKLIPEKGRTLQCGFCDQKWFFKNEKNEDTLIEPIKLEEKPVNNLGKIAINEELDFPKKKATNHIKDKASKINSNFNLSKIFSYFIVFIISLIALIIFLDTFKNNLTSIFPNLELLLFNLFESIRDIKLFINDLIR